MSSSQSKVVVRKATRGDLPALVALNKAAYPVLAKENIIWGETHLASHLAVFPEGQLVAEVDGRIVGAAASLIVKLGLNPLRLHTWSGITDSGYFTNHDQSGDTLYGADVYVHPDARSLGVGHLLYEARRDLCRKLNLRRILAGGRLWNYSDYADQCSPEEYAQRVADGEIRDLVLSFQLREGFELRGVMPNYLRDPNSKNYASLIEWLNPDYKPRVSGARKVRVACIQYQMRKIESYEEFLRQLTYFVDIAADYRSDYILLPELFSMQLLSMADGRTPREGILHLASFTEKFTKSLSDLALRFGVTIIGGSHPTEKDGKLYNICYVCLPDGRIVEQPKLHITPNESRWWGMSGGDTLRLIETPKAKIGVLICYDTEFPETARFLADQGAEIIFVPFCTDNRQGYLRVRYCAQARCIENQVYVAMAGNVGNLPDVMNMDVQYGQAAVLTPSDFAFARDGIAAEADSNEETVLVCDLDLDTLHEARTLGTVTPLLDRRSDLFQVVANIKRDPKPPLQPNEGPLGDQPPVWTGEPLVK